MPHVKASSCTARCLQNLLRREMEQTDSCKIFSNRLPISISKGIYWTTVPYRFHISYSMRALDKILEFTLTSWTLAANAACEGFFMHSAVLAESTQEGNGTNG